MQRRRTLWQMLGTFLLICAACSLWLQRERQQYALNRELISALEHDNTKAALALVNRGADPNTRQEPLPPPTFKSLLNRLLHHSPSPTNDSPTAFQMACGCWFVPLAEKHHQECKSFSSTHQDVRLVQAMLASHANIDVRSDGNATPLADAAQADHPHTVALLLQAGAHVNVKDTGRTTPLMRAARNKTAEATRLLLAHGANINATDYQGWTPLIYAVYSNTVTLHIKTDIISELLAHGANPNLRADNGTSPLTLAQESKRPDIVRLLKQHGAK